MGISNPQFSIFQLWIGEGIQRGSVSWLWAADTSILRKREPLWPGEVLVIATSSLSHFVAQSLSSVHNLSSTWQGISSFPGGAGWERGSEEASWIG